MAINKLNNAANVVFNGSTIPSNTVETLLLLNPVLLKTVDKALAGIGDTLTYTITVTNPGLTTISSVAFNDTVPDGSAYIPDSFEINNSATTPTVAGNTLSYTIPTMAALEVITITFQVTITG